MFTKLLLVQFILAHISDSQKVIITDHFLTIYGKKDLSPIKTAFQQIDTIFQKIVEQEPNSNCINRLKSKKRSQLKSLSELLHIDFETKSESKEIQSIKTTINSISELLSTD